MSELNQASSLLAKQKEKVLATLTNCDSIDLNLTADIIAKSDFLLDSFYRFPTWLPDFIQNPPKAGEEQFYQQWLDEKLITTDDEIMKVIRQFRRLILMRIAWSQLTNSSTTTETLTQLSALAELLLLKVRDILYKQSCQEWGTPCDEEGKPQPLLILGMGKLGGGELNFSSDIDLIFTYPEQGETQGGRRVLDNGTFFTRLGQRIIKMMDQITEDGLVYRVDMRLRPLGEGGPLALSFSAMEDYYQEQGRDWERYAMVKAKVLGDHHYAKALYQMLKPFIYRRYIDFSVLQSLRNMKGMIEREVRRRELNNNIKLGAGGIREIEFIVQVIQLIRGGRLTALQTRSLLTALSVIEEESLLPTAEIEQLRENYLFLRRTENLIQAIHDEQTQTLPENDLDRARVADGMGFVTWGDFDQDLAKRLQQNRHIFNNLIGDVEAEAESYDDRFNELWSADLSSDEVATLLPKIGYDDAVEIAGQLKQFRLDISKRTIGVRGREILDQLMPRLLANICDRSNAVTILTRILPLITNIVSRTTYLELLLEYPAALLQLIKLCATSPMISTQLAHYPLLLDELIDTNTLSHIPAPDEYKSELYQYLLRIESSDEEQQLEALRQFKQMQLLHIAAADVGQLLTTMQVSDHLTYVAEALIDFVVKMAWRQITARYGKPNYLLDGEIGLIVIAYGKLGGWELGYGSDLDLVFLHNCPENSITDGDKVIDSRQFYLRLVQRIIHLFSVRTSFGILYEVDLRLRPQGDAGLLACSLEAFANYQHLEAWTWEHQALVRARVVYGDKTLVQQFNTIRQQVLCQPRSEQTLKNEVREMREKMRTHLDNSSADLFNLKSGAGGIGDIEFLSQYLVLNYADKNPIMTRWTDNVRILEMAAKQQIMQPSEAATLTQIYIAMRNEIHRLALQNIPCEVNCDCFRQEREAVKESWERWLTN
ncbi:bifunctional [glutamate--ammonia ligase]-adenylyl-L-tyrosine phosphorylase/[glutamate--ammonia-ligase] adenylyltransferase [Orbaceae bacterium ESL0721]|nr:bifunctional [glutamate--ammonia ligase]-adenylyl-L-tyrosine phosphorylase/[glutamate--ammonia-ligase] adenylyltransferase [Orbaceae bacterium ESL0721]